MPAMTAAFAGRADVDRTGGVLGVQQSANGLARVVGPLVGGLLFEHVGVAAPYVTGAAFMAICAALVTKT
jgi:predicted MFS family arabinose efflux permease